jgi:DNA primase
VAGIIPKQVLEDIRFRCDIADVIDSYITLPKKGMLIKTLCPFHKEKTPSFTVNRQRQIFHCFGCGAGGDVFKFVMMYDQLDFMGAVRLLAEKAGVALQFDQGGDGPGADRNLLFDIHEKIAARYHEFLLKNPKAQIARDYLQQRQLTGEAVEAFMIGYAPDAWDSVIRWGRTNKVPVEKLELAGLVVRKEEGGTDNPFYDRFRARVMFPIRNEQGRIIGFSGRTLVKDHKGAKYVNSPETPLFRKSHVLYALDRGRRDIVEKREAIVCEGQIDVIRCHQAGFTTAVAAQGTAFTESHARILRRYADGVVLVFDSDEAGRTAAIKASGIFMQAGMAVRVAALPPGEDPDSLILKQGAAAFQKAIDEAVSALDFQINVLQERESGGAEASLLRVSKAVLASISLSPNAVQRDLLVQQAARRLGLSPDALQTELRPLIKAPAPERQDERPAAPAPKPRDEVLLVEHLAASPDLMDMLYEYLPLPLVTDPQCRAFIEALGASRVSGAGLMDVIAEHDDAEQSLSGFAAATLSAPSRGGTEMSHLKAVQDIILALWRAELQRRLTARASSGSAKVAQDEHHMLTVDINRLRKWETGHKIALLYAQSMLPP